MFTFYACSIQNNVENLENTFGTFIHGASGLQKIQEVMSFLLKLWFLNFQYSGLLMSDFFL